MKLVECPRDAMQGIATFIPTTQKVEYLNLLLNVGFDYLDFGSFVSPKAIPQLKDTKEIVPQLQLNSTTKLLAIVANERGAEDAAAFDEVTVLGYPFSVSETFQKRNTNASISESISRVEKIKSICDSNGKDLLVYLSMGFGNPYGDEWNAEIVMHWVNELFQKLGIKYMALADTIGVSTPENIKLLFNTLIPEFENVEIGAHLHSHPNNWKEKMEALAEVKCPRIDGALMGMGGCPMAEDDLVGNLAMENVISFLIEKNIVVNYASENFQKALKYATNLFGKYH